MADETIMKIQINSLEALERLIGNDTAMEIELRSRIVQEFAKEHLKAVAKSETITAAVKTAQDEILRLAQIQLNDAVASFSQTYEGGVQNLKLRPFILEAIKQQVASQVEGLIQKAVSASIVEKLAGDAIKLQVERRMEYYTKSVIDAAVRDKLDAVKAQL